VEVEHRFKGLIKALVVGVGLVFTMLWTYMSLISGLSARKSESNSGCFYKS
jgi:hypothetical protein